MSRYVTFTKQDTEYPRYLWGSFSKEERAIAVKSLNVNTSEESITFEIQPKKNISFKEKWIASLKIPRLILVLLPLFILFFTTMRVTEMDHPLESFLATLGVIFLHYFAIYRNDYKDYVIGTDRVSDENDNLIMKGYYSAIELKRVALVCLGIGILLGLPSVILNPVILPMLSLVAVFAAIIYSGMGWGSKNRPLGEFFVFLTYGPLLALGYQFTLVGGYNYEGLAIGVICGFINLILIHLRNFERILSYSRAQLKSTIVLLGFEKSKMLLLLMWIGLGILFMGYSWFFDYEILLGSSALFFVTSALVLVKKLRGMQSCIGSDLTQLRRMGEKFVIAISLIWALITLVG